MKITLSTGSLTSAKADLLALAVHGEKGLKTDTLKRLDAACGGAVLACAHDEGFKGKAGETLRISVKGRVGARWVVLVGTGDADATSTARALGVRTARAVRQMHTVAVAAPYDEAAAVRALAEGLATGAYRYDRWFTGSRKPKGGLKAATVVVGKANTAVLKRAIADGITIAESVNMVRDLVNDPPNELHPTALAEAARAACAKAGVKCTIWDKKQIAKQEMNLLLAVSRGTNQEPRVVHMTYKPENATRKVVFVGKGLTFDSGGLCIKPAKSMGDMKCDMAGAAATIGIVVTAARLGIPVEVHGIIGAVENMSGGSAYRPGDIFKSRDGKTVEIINTDAEGRLVLADLLAYARELKPDYMIDHATLTGACMVALGQWTAGLFANDDEFAKLYADAAKKSGESFWRLPLNAELKETLKSSVADLKHTGDTHGGAITAALFLEDFVAKTKWAHCDIAGPAFLPSLHANMPKDATGFGVTTGLAFLEALAARPA